MDNKPHFGLKIWALCGVLFLHIPIMVIFLYAFSTDEKTFQFPIPGFTTGWFAVVWGRTDIWQAISLSLQVASIATIISLIMGTMAALAMARFSFFGKDSISLLFILPIALPGILSGIALRSSIGFMGVEFSTWTIIIGHATFTIVVVYNNVIARLWRISPNLWSAGHDLRANHLQVFVHIILPNIAGSLIAGGLLAFALSFDEIIVTTFTAGQQTTLPIWMMNELIKPRIRPVTNIVAMAIIVITIIPIMVSVYLSNKDIDG